MQPKQQKAMLLGEKKGAAIKSTKQEADEEVVTDKMLAELKQKLLSSRDQFILSNRDMLPEAELPKASPAIMKKQSSMMNE